LSESETNQPVPIRAIVSRFSKGDPKSTIRTGKLAVNLSTRVVSVDDHPVRLTGKEYAILELLSLRKGTILTKEMFLDHLYREMDEPEPKIMDVFICNLRKKLAQATGGNHYIETVWATSVQAAPVPTNPNHHSKWHESPAQNVRKSQHYDRLVASNNSFRANRMKKECGPIRDPELRASCVGSFNEYEPR
jgi:DNA-binding winged helix-turn-helix (wHTH) protein